MTLKHCISERPGKRKGKDMFRGKNACLKLLTLKINEDLQSKKNRVHPKNVDMRSARQRACAIILLWVWLKGKRHLSLVTRRMVTRLAAPELSSMSRDALREALDSPILALFVIYWCPFAVRFFIVSGGVFVWLRSIEY